MNLLDESSCQKLVDLLANDLVLLLVEAAQALLHWSGISSDLQGVLGDFCRCFPLGGSHQLVKLVCVLPFPDGDARKDTKIYPGSGKRRPYVQWGECLYYLAPKCLYRGEYKSVWMEG